MISGRIWGMVSLKKSAEAQSAPPLYVQADQPNRVYVNTYYTDGPDGEYQVHFPNLDLLSPATLEDSNGDPIARILPGTGRIEVLDSDYQIQPLFATVDLPTRIGILDRMTEEIAGNVYYVPDLDTDVSIKSVPLTTETIGGIGVTIGDANPDDDIIAKNIPGSAPSFPGGAAIYNQTPPQTNIAMIGTNGAIRFNESRLSSFYSKSG